MSRGFIYVLVNPALPGMVKVGRTANLPDVRAGQLSSATGTPVPFIVAYSAAVDDMSEAEAQVHAILEERCGRVATNREFFRADSTEAINAVMTVVSAQRVVGRQIPHMVGGTESPDQPWNDDEATEAETYRVAAEAAYQGDGEVFQDTREAIRLFELAIGHGSVEARYDLGCLYADDEEFGDEQLAKKHLLKAAQSGYVLGYVKLAELYATRKQFDNAVKCWQRVWATRPDPATLGGIGFMYVGCIRRGMPHAFKTELQTHYRSIYSYLQNLRETNADDYYKGQIGQALSLLTLIVHHKRATSANAGVVSRIFHGEGWGFILPPHGEEVFFHSSAFLGDFESLSVSDRVEYEIEMATQGPRAVNVLRALFDR